MQASALDSIVSFDQFREVRKNVFPSSQSLLWYVRRQKADLIMAGAIMMVRGAWHIHANNFDTYFLKESSAAAETAFGRIARRAAQPA
jgi:hypothetical protein